MISKRLFRLTVALLCMALLCGSICAAQVDSDSVYCFTAEDFQQEGQLTGICIMELPDAASGTVMLGNRVVRAGDILTAQQLAQMTFVPLQTTEDQVAQVKYLPIYENRVEQCATMTISIFGKQDKAPVAEDSALETYKNLSNQGKLKASDPEGKELTYTVTRQPKRGTLTVNADGSFEYTPKKNKVGVDSFAYTVTDPAGNVSREATVTIQILKSADSRRYTDTVGADYRFAAEWMKNTGLFVGETIGGNLCFNGDKTVSKGEFMAMMIKALNIPVDEALSYNGYTDEIPEWLKPYVAAALRSGLTAGLPSSETGIFGADEAITGGEVAVMLCNAMDLSVSTSSMDDGDPTKPVWAMAAVEAINENGFSLTAVEQLTRAQVAQILYQVSTMADELPSLAMYQ